MYEETEIDAPVEEEGEEGTEIDAPVEEEGEEELEVKENIIFQSNNGREITMWPGKVGSFNAPPSKIFGDNSKN